MRRWLPLALLLCVACDREDASNGVTYAAPEQPSGATRTFVSSEFKVSMQVPAEWRPQPQFEAEAASADGQAYVNITALGGLGDVRDACAEEAGHRMQPHGDRPTVEAIQIDGQPACRIVPTDGYAVQKRIPAAIIALYPRPLDLPGPAHTRDYPYLVVWTDPPHLPMIERSLRFVR